MMPQPGPPPANRIVNHCTGDWFWGTARDVRRGVSFGKDSKKIKAIAAVGGFKVGMLNRVCWASELGDCDQLTREHVLSRCVAKALGNSIDMTVGNRRLGSDALKLKYLCKRHNNALSEIDNEAGRFFDSIHGYHQKPLQELRLNNEIPPEQAVCIDGVKLERWAVKTFLNNAVFSGCMPDRMVPSSAVRGSKVLRYVFGLEPAPDHVTFLCTDDRSGATSVQRFNMNIHVLNSRIYRQATNELSQEFQIPAFLQFNLYGYEFSIGADLTNLSAQDFDQLLRYKLPRRADSVARPVGLKFWRTARDDRYQKLHTNLNW
jgi:hypothetical protein